MEGYRIKSKLFFYNYEIKQNSNTPNITFYAIVRVLFEDKLRSHVQQSSDVSPGLLFVFIICFALFGESKIA